MCRELKSSATPSQLLLTATCDLEVLALVQSGWDVAVYHCSCNDNASCGSFARCAFTAFPEPSVCALNDSMSTFNVSGFPEAKPQRAFTQLSITTQAPLFLHPVNS